jgi:PIN domain nuclease of toxin-antitoxin system
MRIRPCRCRKKIGLRICLNSFGVNEVAATGSIAMGAVAEELPDGDPADRIVVATARSL